LPLLDLIGAPQIAALLVLSQRGLEELYSAKNTKALLAESGREAGSAFYPVVAATHLAWIASLFFLIPPDAIILWPLIAYYLVLRIVRYWVIGSLAASGLTASSRSLMRRSWLVGPIAICPIRISGHHHRDLRAAFGVRRARARRDRDAALVDRAQLQDQT
jgi:hypothetical protein